MKILFLLIGLAIGFGGGVWWGVQHPSQAAQLADDEQQKFLQAQIKVTETIKQKLDQIAARQSQSSGKGFGSGFVSGTSTGTPDPDISALRDQQDQQLQQLRQRLDQLKK